VSGWWFVALAFVVAANPPRLHHALPPEDDVRFPATALGTGIGFAVLVGVAAAASPLLEAADVSDSTMRVAAGLVLAATGLVDLWGPFPRSEPALPGWQAGLVPLAFPLLLRPAVVLFGLAAGADAGVARAAIGAALALGVVLASAAVSPTQLDPRVRRTADGVARLVAAGLIAVGVALTVNGVLDV